MGELGEDGGSEDDDFSHGAPTFPAFFNNIFGAKNGENNTDGSAKSGGKKKEKKDKNRKHLNLYCEDLTRKAREGKIDNIVGRDKEIERVIQILSRRTKNNPCLIGEPGVCAPNKKEFQEIVKALAARNNIGMSEDELLLEANKWELSHGGLSGRTAQQFIDYLAGKQQ